MKMTRFLATLLTAFLLLGMNTVCAETAYTGNKVCFGFYEQDGNLSNGMEPIEWTVLAVENGKVLLFSDYALDCVPYYVDNVDTVRWEDSYLRRWLNYEFLLTAFSPKEREKIAYTVVKPSDAALGNENHGAAVYDKAFILNFDEACRYYNEVNEFSFGCYAADYAVENGVDVDGYCSWYVRSNDDGSNVSPFFVQDKYLDVNPFASDRDRGIGVRPCVWVFLSCFDEGLAVSAYDPALRPASRPRTTMRLNNIPAPTATPEVNPSVCDTWGHSFVPSESVREPAVNQMGIMIYCCENCGMRIQINTPAIEACTVYGHQIGVEEILMAPTEKYEGVVRYVCAICGEFANATMPRLASVPTPAPINIPTPTPMPTPTPTPAPTPTPSPTPTSTPTPTPTPRSTPTPTPRPTPTPTPRPTPTPTATPRTYGYRGDIV